MWIDLKYYKKREKIMVGVKFSREITRLQDFARVCR
jgi:hypothetical protein